MCSSFASKAFEEIDFWREREREVQKQPWCDDDDDDDDAEERAAFVARLLAFERFFFLFFFLLKILSKFLYFNIKP